MALKPLQATQIDASRQQPPYQQVTQRVLPDRATQGGGLPQLPQYGSTVAAISSHQDGERAVNKDQIARSKAVFYLIRHWFFTKHE